YSGLPPFRVQGRLKQAPFVRNNPHPLWVVGMIAVLLDLPRKPGRFVCWMALLSGLLSTGCQRIRTHDEADAVIQSFPAQALQDYLPRDAVAVFNLDLKQWREAPSTQNGLLDAFQQVLRQEQAVQEWLKLTGIDPLRDCDEARVFVSSRALLDPLLLLRGRID